MYQVELVWNREFRYVPYGKEFKDLDKAKAYATSAKDMGDGARVKKVQVIDLETGEIVAENHEL